MTTDEIRAYACATCNGTGLYDDDTCRDCSGTGIDNQN